MRDEYRKGSDRKDERLCGQQKTPKRQDQMTKSEFVHFTSPLKKFLGIFSKIFN